MKLKSIIGFVLLFLVASVVIVFVLAIYDSLVCDEDLKTNYSYTISKCIWKEEPDSKGFFSMVYFLSIQNGSKIIHNYADYSLYPSNESLKVNEFYLERYSTDCIYCRRVDWPYEPVSDSVLQDFFTHSGLQKSDFDVPAALIEATSSKKAFGFQDAAEAHSFETTHGQDGTTLTYLRKLFGID